MMNMDYIHHIIQIKNGGSESVKVSINAGSLKSADYKDIPKDIVKAYRQAMFEQREMPDSTILYRMEEKLFSCVRQGEPEKIEEYLSEFASGKLMGCMSKDPLRQVQYTFIAGITLMTRSAIAGGMPEIEAYNLSDVYAQKVDVCKKEADIMALFAMALFDFATRVRQVRKKKRYSYPVSLCISYISDHLHYQITLSNLAKQCKLTPQYLSTLFHKETGRTITDYIMDEKLETAKQMLAYSQHTLQEIASNLGFSSHSNFTLHFRKHYRMTPSEYRNSSRTYHLELH
jgi:AraC-like DNA-binding protein